MDINLTDHVVILDEAHNIEDAAREAGSCMVEDDHVIGTYLWTVALWWKAIGRVAHSEAVGENLFVTHPAELRDQLIRGRDAEKSPVREQHRVLLHVRIKRRQ